MSQRNLDHVYSFRVELRLHEYWHFCQGGRVLLGSWALREQHLGFMGYQLLPMSGSAH